MLIIVRQFYPWVGGAERTAQRLAARLIQVGLDVRIVTGWWFRGTPQQEIIASVPIFRNFTCWNMFDLRGLRKLAGYVYIVSLLAYLWDRRRQYDVIHVHLLSYPAWPAVIAGRWLGKKVVIRPGNSGPYSDILRMRQSDLLPGQRYLLPTVLRAGCFIALSPEIEAELCQAGVPPERIVSIPNGVELGAASKTSYSLNDAVTIVYVGRLHPSKGLGVLLSAFAQAAQTRPQLRWRLVIVGEGVLRPELEAQAANLGLADAVQFVGQVQEVSPHLAQGDIFVLPSLSEGISNALLEAMAHGLPCVATRIGGNTTLIRDGETGLLVALASTEALAAALTRLVDDQALRERLGRRARALVEADFGMDQVAQRYRELYTALANADRGSTNISWKAET
ncbi:MAG: glycosyltransferase family 4 protein [Anaerolineales bacterium]|nr:glycosyltransferase family 4 protein [Anaerolineales bacterium]